MDLSFPQNPQPPTVLTNLLMNLSSKGQSASVYPQGPQTPQPGPRGPCLQPFRSCYSAPRPNRDCQSSHKSAPLCKTSAVHSTESPGVSGHRVEHSIACVFWQVCPCGLHFSKTGSVGFHCPWACWKVLIPEAGPIF